MAEEPILNAPIPGQALTSEMGSRPWQNPPQMVTVEEAIDYYIPLIAASKFTKAIIESMESGIQLTDMANSLQLSGVMEGKHTLDVGLLVAPVIVQLLMVLAEEAGIKYNSGLLPTSEEDSPYSEATLARIRSEMEGMVDEGELKELSEEEVMVDEDTQETQSAGLMARRQ